MDVQVRGHDITVDESLRRFVVQRTARLDHLVNRVVEAKLELRQRHNRSGGDIVIAQLTIQTGRHILRAEEQDRQAEAAIDKAIDKLARQVRRYHDRRTDRKASRTDATLLPALDAEDEVGVSADIEDGDEHDEAAPALDLVRTKRFALKPMDVVEAIEQLDLLGHDFYLFQNADEQQLNVIYRRRDGTFGLLAPSR